MKNVFGQKNFPQRTQRKYTEVTEKESPVSSVKNNLISIGNPSV